MAAAGQIVRLESALRVDLATLRDTLAYFRSDLCGVRGCEAIGEALDRAIQAIDTVRPRGDPPLPEAGEAWCPDWWPDQR